MFLSWQFCLQFSLIDSLVPFLQVENSNKCKGFQVAGGKPIFDETLKVKFVGLAHKF